MHQIGFFYKQDDLRELDKSELFTIPSNHQSQRRVAPPQVNSHMQDDWTADQLRIITSLRTHTVEFDCEAAL